MKKYLITFWLFLWIYSIWSYLYTDPNLLLVSWQPYIELQNAFWEFLKLNRGIAASMYGVLILVFWWAYYKIVSSSSEKSWQFSRNALVWYGVFLLPLILSYNALSHDVFNYIFNAKMVVVYGADPHNSVALDFASDTWTRFMHNTHTPAPYGYGWTVLSLIPYLLGMGKFILTWLSFRLWSVISLGFLIYAMQQFSKSLFSRPLTQKEVALVVFNPLILIEIIGVMHNDLWMMAAVMLSFALLVRWQSAKKTEGVALLLYSILLLLFSISIKLVTVVLVPVWLILLSIHWWYPILAASKHVPKKIKELVESHESFAQGITCISLALLFVPLTTARSQQFHPWYWTWLGAWLLWLPPVLTLAVQSLAISSQLRYIPWLWHGYHSDDILIWQKMVTWVGGVVLFSLCWFWYKKMAGKKL